MKQVPVWIRNDEPPLYATVDDEDYELVSAYRWRAVRGPTDVEGSYYAHSFKLRKDGPRVPVWMHKLVAAAAGLDLSNEIDHKDRNRLNNVRSNLRPATRNQNMMNS